jgi:GNAT-family acetyltransferase (TIGR03103 family)
MALNKISRSYLFMKQHLRHRLAREQGFSLRNWDRQGQWQKQFVANNIVINCGWGRLIFGHTFHNNKDLAQTLCEEVEGKRDIAFYVRDPHVVTALMPQEVFLDPSHTYRLWPEYYRPNHQQPKGFIIRFLNSHQDAAEIQSLYLKRRMIPPGADFVWKHRQCRLFVYLVAVDGNNEEIVGVAQGVDHYHAFADPEHGTSLWAVAVDPQAPYSGIGEALVRHLAEYYFTRGRAFMDLSVMYNNIQAINLYEKLGFKRVPVFSLKHKSPFNEPLYIAPEVEAQLNPYAKIIIKEARRRGIGVEVLDEIAGYFALSFGGRTIVCRESLTELTSAIAMSRCDDKAVTRRLFIQAGLKVPAQIEASNEDEIQAFLNQYSRLVVKPARGEQGVGISVDVRTLAEINTAIDRARQINERVLLEQYVEGQDLRIVVIDFKVVAAAVRKSAQIIGTGHHQIAELIEKQSRRRAAATGGESRIPMDAETVRCIQTAGYHLDSILPQDETLIVRKTANLHTGGTIHDVSPQLHSTLKNAAIRAAQVLDIPVVGLDFLVPAVNQADYVIIEANERPGLANHEPQPTAECFIDLLFPQTSTR